MSEYREGPEGGSYQGRYGGRDQYAGRDRSGGRGKGGYGRGYPGGGGGGGGRGRGNPEQGWQSQEQGYRAMEKIMASVSTVSHSPSEPIDITPTSGPLTTYPIVRRPDGGGRVGRRVSLCANHFLLDCSSRKAFQYDIEITSIPNIPPGLLDEKDEARVLRRPQEDLPMGLCRDIISKCAELNGWPLNNWIFDGKRNLFSPEEFLGAGKHELKVSLPGERRERVFQVAIQWAASIDLMDLYRYIKQSDIPLPQSSIQVIEVALRFGAEMMPNCIPSGRSLFFDDKNTNRKLPGGAELWLGYHQSVKPCQLGLTLNIDTTAGAFLQTRGVLEVLVEAAGLRDVKDFRRGISDQQSRRMKKAVCGLMVVTTHRGGNNQKRKVKGITQDAARDLCFEGKDGNRQSVAQYWQKTYGSLELDFLPCLDVSRGSKLNYLPPEVCMVAPGQSQRKLSDAQAREVITFTAKKPHERKQEIQHALDCAGLSNDGVVRNFGISVKNRMVELEGRMLPQPHLEYTKPGSLDTGNRGQWNLGGIQFLKGGKIIGWGLVSFERQDRVSGPGDSGLRGFTSGLMSTLKELGLDIPESPPTLVHGDPRQSPIVAMETCLQRAATQFGEVNILLVLLPTTDAGLYKAVKSAGNMVLGIPTQCFVASKAGIGCQPRGRLQYLANLGMKINHKVGGINTRLAGLNDTLFPTLAKRPFIILGADVTHPLGFDSSEPSVAAIVGSMDGFLGQFATRVIVQKHRQELIDARQPVKELLISFYQRTNLKPEGIIMYRDGISDGQFQKCLQHEYSQIRQACKDLEEDYTPPITFVVVQKRHHTRLFPKNPREGDRNGNVHPGTVVDTGIVGPTDFEFFLNSQAGIQGTNKPARYHVLLDENGFGSDALQLMTYWMCYLYCRCTRSVSYVPAAFYAHLAAAHGKLLVSETSSEVDGVSKQEAYINEGIEDVMFYI